MDNIEYCVSDDTPPICHKEPNNSASISQIQIIMELTCPELEMVDADNDSDYASKDTSKTDDFVIGGFCLIFPQLDSKCD